MVWMMVCGDDEIIHGGDGGEGADVRDARGHVTGEIVAQLREDA